MMTFTFIEWFRNRRCTDCERSGYFDFNGSLIPGLHRFIGDNPVLLVGNKVDILPKSLKT